MEQWTIERIRRMRIAAGLSQSQFADKYGIPKRTIEDWERGIRKPQQYVIDLLGARVAMDFGGTISFQESYDYSELLNELRAEIAHGLIKSNEVIQVKYDDNNNIVDWYYDRNTMEDMLDDILEAYGPEAVEKYRQDLPKLKNVNVMEIIEFMQSRQLLSVD